MTVIPRIISDQAPMPRASARVSRVAELLDCDESDVRRLIDRGELQAHGLGKRGVRVYLDSVTDYQDAQRRPVKKTVDKPPPARNPARAAQIQAEADLRKSGILR